MNHFDFLQEFEKEFKRLLKKYRTLPDDLEKFQKVLVSFPTGVGKNFTILHSTETVKIVKARMACRALRDRSLRVIYAYFEQKQCFEYIEIYYKGEKENEDRERIREYLKRDEVSALAREAERDYASGKSKKLESLEDLMD